MSKIKEIHIYDIDGVLVDSSRRYRTLSNGKIDLQHWTDSRILAPITDCLLPLAVQYAQQCNDDTIAVLIATARQVTLDEYIWLNENLPVPYGVVSRAHGDDRPSVEQKVSGLLPILADLPLAATRYYYDDTAEVCYKVARQINAIPVPIHSKQGSHTWKF